MYVHGEYFPCVVARVDGDSLGPGCTGGLTIRAVMRAEDLELPRGTRIELREALGVLAVGELFAIAAIT